MILKQEYLKIKNNSIISIDAIFISKLILFNVEKTKTKIGPIKLQKLLWYFNIYYIYKNSINLFNENFQAWTYGPVNYNVWKHYNMAIYNFSYNDISNILQLPKFETDFLTKLYNENILDDESELLLEKINDCIFTVLKCKLFKSTFFLVDETHQQEPWLKARGNKPKEKPSDKEIELTDKNCEYIVNKYLK